MLSIKNYPLADDKLLKEKKKGCLENKARLFINTKNKHERSGQETDRGSECLDGVSAGEAHRGEDGNALLGGRVGQRGGGTHGAVSGGGTRIHHGGQRERFCKV